MSHESRELLKDYRKAIDQIIGLRARVAELERMVHDDAFAMTFQSMGQYRSALLKALKP
jgi:hypothetical protein